MQAIPTVNNYDLPSFTFDGKEAIVKQAITLMSQETLVALASKQLEKEAWDAVRRNAKWRNHNGVRQMDTIASEVFHTLKRHMENGNAQTFANAVYEETGIDTRTSRTVRNHMPISLAAISQVIDMGC